MMICYRDRSYCTDMDYCKTMECSKRLTPEESKRAKEMRLPVAWMPYRDLCGKFEEKKDA